MIDLVFLLIMKRAELIANFFIGVAGATGQAVLLSHVLESYPFKILISPPGNFYSSAAHIVVLIAPVLALLALRVFRSTRRPFVTAIPVVACPLLFWILFRVVFAFSGYSYPSKGSDLIATSAIESGFANWVLGLTLAGFGIGLLCGVMLWAIFRVRPNINQI